jgi:hypothetical protein
MKYSIVEMIGLICSISNIYGKPETGEGKPENRDKRPGKRKRETGERVVKG